MCVTYSLCLSSCVESEGKGLWFVVAGWCVSPVCLFGSNCSLYCWRVLSCCFAPFFVLFFCFPSAHLEVRAVILGVMSFWPSPCQSWRCCTGRVKLLLMLTAPLVLVEHALRMNPSHPMVCCGGVQPSEECLLDELASWREWCAVIIHAWQTGGETCVRILLQL